MTDLGTDLLRASALFENMPDHDRVRFIAATFIAAVERHNKMKSGTLSEDFKRYLTENTEKLVYWEGGHRDAVLLLTQAQKYMDSYLPKPEEGFVSDMLNILADLSYRVVRSLGEGAYKAGSAVLSKAGEQAAEKAEQVADKVVDSFLEKASKIFDEHRTFAYVGIGVGAVGTAVTLWLSTS